MSYKVSKEEKNSAFRRSLKFTPLKTLIFAVIFAGVGVSLMWHSFAATNIYYVSPSGSDTNNGTSLGSAFKTISKAASVVVGGDTVMIESGTYAEDVTFSRSGVSGSPITFQNDVGSTVSVRSLNYNANYVTVTGLTVAGATGHCVTIQPAKTALTFQGGNIYNCGRDGIRFVRPENTGASYTTQVNVLNNKIYNVGLTNSASNIMTVYADNITVDGNEMYSTRNDAINMWGNAHTYRKNYIHDIVNSVGNHNDAFQTWRGFSPDDGVQGKAVTNLLIEQNIVKTITGGNGHCGIGEGPGHSNWTIRNNVFQTIGNICWIFDTNETGTNPVHPGISNVLVYNNTFVNAGANDTLEFNGATAPSTTGKMANNIFYNTAQNYFKISSNVTRDYNFYGGTTPLASETHRKTGNPVFVSSTDFHLQSTSPAINAGDNGAIISPVRSADLDGNPNVGIVDMGAYEYGSSSADTQPPSVPANLSATATSSSQINLSWSASTDNKAVTQYKIYRNGSATPLTIVNAPATTYSDTGLTASTTYSYQVSALDAAGNESAKSSTASATTQAPPQFSCSGSTAYICEDFSSSASNFTNVGGTWSVTGGKYVLTNPAQGTDPSVSLYNKALHSSAVSGDFTMTFDGSTTGTASNFNDFGAVFDYQDDNNYYFIDFNETDGIDTNGILKMVNGVQTKLAGFPGVIVSDQTYAIKIVKTGSNISVYRDNTLVATATDTSFNSGKMGLGTRNDSAIFDSLTVLGNPPDTTAPTNSITSPSNNATVNGTVTVSASASDNVGVTKVEFYIDNVLTSTLTASPYSFGWNTLGVNNGSHTITSKSYDAAGNVSSPSFVTVIVNNPDTQPPTVPTNLSGTPISPTRVDLSWTVSTDNVAVANYVIKRNGVSIGTSTSANFSDTTAAGSTTYSYTVAAVDTSGNASADSSPVSVTTPTPPDTTPPPAPVLSLGMVTSGQVNISWNPVSDPSGISTYHVYRNGSEIATTTTTTYGDGTVTPGTQYTYTVKAEDGANNLSVDSNQITTTPPNPAPVTLNFSPSADSYISNSSYKTRRANYGSSTGLTVDATPIQSSLLKFNVSGVGTRTITGAKLRLYVSNASNNGGSFYKILDNSWTESSVTWNNQPARSSTAITSLSSVFAGGYVEADVTPTITSDGTFGFFISSTSGDAAIYNSKESSSNKPQLVLTVQ